MTWCLEDLTAVLHVTVLLMLAILSCALSGMVCGKWEEERLLIMTHVQRMSRVITSNHQAKPLELV